MRAELGAREAPSPASPAARRAAAAAAEEDEDGATAGPGSEGGKGAPLPEIDELVARLPAEVRETLDELFRARFVAVKKLPKKLFRPATTKGPPQAGAAA